jgi:hypothetical protein
MRYIFKTDIMKNVKNLHISAESAFKEALLHKRLEEGDEQLIRQITDAELSS